MKAAALASAALALAGCGDSAEPAADARLADVALDATPGPLTVTLMRAIDFVGQGGGPAVGAPVYFVEPDGTATRVLTDGDGRATAVVGAGATVYCQQPSEAGTLRAFAVTGLGPGLDFTIESARFPSFSPPSVGTAQITLPSVPGAAFYSATVSCGDFTASGGAPFLTTGVHACARLEHGTVLTEAFDVDSRLLAYGVAHDVDLRGTFTAPRDVPADRRPVSSVTTFTSVPPVVSSIRVVRTHRDGDVVSVAAAEPRRPEGSVVAFELPVAAIGDRSDLVTTLTGNGGALGVGRHVQRFATPAVPVTVDLGADMLPFMTRPSINLTARAAAWTYVGGVGRRPDLVMMTASYNQDRPVTLVVIGPGDRTHVELPPFPPELTDLLPPPASVPDFVDYLAVDAVGADFPDLVGHAYSDLTAARFDVIYPRYDDIWLSGTAINALR